ncbi:hypothetical protein D1872_178940 [compost metagenome]
MFKAIADGFNWLFDLLATLFSRLMDGLLWLLQPLFDILNIIFQFIYWIGQIIFKIIQLVFGVGKLLIGMVAGLFRTLLGFGYTGKGATLPGSYAEVYANIRPYLNSLQLDKVAYIMQFSIWIFTAFMAIRIMGNMKGGGGSE